MRLNKNITERLNLLKEAVGFLPDEKILPTYLKIANIYTKECRYVSAIKFYKKGLQISKRLFGINNVEVANFYNDTGYAFLLKKDFENSIKNFQKSLITRIKVLGEIHQDTAISYYNLGVAFLEKEDYIKAFEFNSKALEIYLRIYGDSSNSVAKCYANIAAICEVADEYKLAIKNYKKAYKISKKLLGNIYKEISNNGLVETIVNRLKQEGLDNDQMKI